MTKTIKTTKKATPQRKGITARKQAATTKKRRIAKTQHRRVLGLRWHHFGGVALLVLGVTTAAVTWLAGPPAPGSAATSCPVSAILVNPCRPWLGAAASQHTEVPSDPKSQILWHEQRIGRQLDVAHTYHPAGNDQLSSSDVYFASRPNTILVTNWKPSAKFSDATGGNAGVNAGIDQMARSIKAVAPHKIILVVYHEPENDVSGGATGCPATMNYKGSAGTPADYVAMWHNIRARFDAQGVTNVVWAMNYMGFPNWDCMEKEMWPGNNYVDWILWDPYASSNSADIVTSINRFYSFLSANSSPATDYLSKPWGLDEWGAFNVVDQPHTYKVYDDAKAALDNNTFPRIKMWNIFDALDLHTDATPSGVKDPTEQAHYNAFAQDPRFTDAFYLTGSGGGGGPAPGPSPSPDQTNPTVSIDAPVAGVTLANDVTIAARASDNVGVKAVTLRVDGTYVATDDTAPYAFTIDSSKYKDGNHTLTVRAFDAANNMGEASVNVTFKNTPPGVIVTPPTATTGPVTTLNGSAGPASVNSPIAVEGTVVVTPLNPDNPQDKVTATIDGKPVVGTSIDSTKLTNGIHTIGITENGTTQDVKIEVKNPWYKAAVNEFNAHPVAYVGGTAGITGSVVALWLLRPQIYYAIQRYKTRNYVHF